MDKKYKLGKTTIFVVKKPKRTFQKISKREKEKQKKISL